MVRDLLGITQFFRAETAQELRGFGWHFLPPGVVMVPTSEATE